MKATEPIVLSVWETLKPKHKAVMCNAVRTYGPYKDAHEGMLPFFGIKMVTSCLELLSAMDDHRRLALECMTKLGKFSDSWVGPTARQNFSIYLTPAKISKRFGGADGNFILPWADRNKKFSLPEQDLSPMRDDVFHIKSSVMQGKTSKEKSWVHHIQCAAMYRYQLEMWLIDHCQ